MNEATQHAEWLNLIDRTGPFLSPLVLEGAFPDGLDKVETALRKRLRDAYGEWRDAIEEGDSELPGLHRAWIQLVLEELLEFDDEILLVDDSLPETLSYTALEHGTIVRPDMALDTNGRIRLLVTILEPDTDPDVVVRGESWPASPVERMTLLCRATGVSLGLVTDGERWMLVFAPKDGPAEHGTWYAHYWRREPITLRAFASLLGVRRFFGPEAGWPETLLEKSLEYQDEVTDTLGEQVRRAVEMLVQALDRADVERKRELLRDVRPAELYEAGLTVMMRLVFLLCAEERGLLLLGDEAYDRHYAISTLRAQLGEEASRVGLEVLERRHDAWSRLLATFRGIYGGISHEALRLPALGGSLFDPDRFPFLEGRTLGSSWKETSAFPLPIDNRTVLALLRALQVLEQRGGAQALSYKALGVEQIGYVYEGLLEQTVARVPEATLGLTCSQKAKRSDVPLLVLEKARGKGQDALVNLLEEITGRSTPALTNLLGKEVDEDLIAKILLSCGGDDELAKRVKPFGHLLRTDLWGAPLVYRKDAFAVTFGTDRRESGSHYTPKVLTEKIVTETLEPVAYVGPAEGHQRDKWRLKSPAELLDLKVCDPAMGSGAFLVQVCRWLGQRLVEAWGQAEREGKVLTVDGDVLDGLDGSEPMSDNAEERLLLARRLIAERCLYGVDLNPLAVELAKLSIWLVTLAQGRPFGFLDHNLRHGDSLLGLHNLEQITKFSLRPEKKQTISIFASNIRVAVQDALALRKKLREIPIRDIRDVQCMERLDKKAREKLEPIEHVADAMIGEALVSGGNERVIETALDNLSTWAATYIEGVKDAGRKIIAKARKSLSVDLPSCKSSRKPFHWPLEFPEVFERGGFDGIVGNPPFIYGKNISKNLGVKYNSYLCFCNSSATKNSDISAHFVVRASCLIGANSAYGFLCTSSISEGETREAGLEKILKEGFVIYKATVKMPWPGKANVLVNAIHVYSGDWNTVCELNGKAVESISSSLSSTAQSWSLQPLVANSGIATRGIIPNGKGFIVSNKTALKWIQEEGRYSDVVMPYLIGKDLNSDPNQKAQRHIINFWDWNLEDAKKYPLALKTVEGKVKPFREEHLNKSKKKLIEQWWLYEASAKEMFKSLGTSRFYEDQKYVLPNLTRAIAIARVSKTGAFTFVDHKSVFAEVTVFATDSATILGILQSNIHLVFAWENAGKMKNDLRYSPSLCFLPFPMPEFGSIEESFGSIVVEYSELRAEYMKCHNIGLTELYKKFHCKNQNDYEISSLRELSVKIDYAVAKAYGWDDLGLEHRFHTVEYLPKNDNFRFTISETARSEVLHRLTNLNKVRFEEEVGQGLHDKKKKKSSTPRKKKNESAKKTEVTSSNSILGEDEAQYELFSLPLYPVQEQTSVTAVDIGHYWLDEAADKILEWLENHEGWHLKETILLGSGVNLSQWDEAITKLLNSKGIQVRGTSDGRRYRVNI